MHDLMISAPYCVPLGQPGENCGLNSAVPATYFIVFICICCYIW